MERACSNHEKGAGLIHWSVAEGRQTTRGGGGGAIVGGGGGVGGGVELAVRGGIAPYAIGLGQDRKGTSPFHIEVTMKKINWPLTF